MGADEETISEYYTPYSQSMLEYAWKNIKNDLKTMKFALKLLTVIFSDMEPSKDNINDKIAS